MCWKRGWDSSSFNTQTFTLPLLSLHLCWSPGQAGNYLSPASIEKRIWKPNPFYFCSVVLPIIHLQKYLMPPNPETSWCSVALFVLIFNSPTRDTQLSSSWAYPRLSPLVHLLSSFQYFVDISSVFSYLLQFSLLLCCVFFYLNLILHNVIVVGLQEKTKIYILFSLTYLARPCRLLRTYGEIKKQNKEILSILTGETGASYVNCTAFFIKFQRCQI